MYQQLRAFVDTYEPLPPLSPYLEISTGQILMTVSSFGAHDLSAMRIARQLQPQLADGLVACATYLEHRPEGLLRRPDLVVLADEDMATNGAVDARSALLVVEVVSPSNPENDYVAKVRDYPLMGVPHYLIVDPRDGTCVHHWGIDAGSYANVVHYRFGDKVPLGDWIVDTGELSVYPTAAGG